MRSSGYLKVREPLTGSLAATINKLTDTDPMTTSIPTAMIADTIELLTGHLATADAAAKVATAEVDRLRAEIAGIMIESDTKKVRTCWGLVSLTQNNKITFSDAIALLEVQLKAAKDAEKITGAATIEPGKSFIKVTWAR